MHFSSSYDRTTKIVTATVGAFLVLVAIASQSLIVAGISAAILLGGYAFSPRGYMLADESILVDRLIGEVRIPLRGLREARRATSNDFCGGIRLFGSGGLFGYYGLFRSAKLGKSHWYVTDRAKAVVVRTSDRVVVVSPDDPDVFLHELHPPAQREGEDLIVNEPDVSLGWAPKLLGAVVGAAAVVLVILAISYAPGPDGYTLTPQSLTIHDRFYAVTLNADTVNVEGIRMIDLRTDPEWRPTRRTNGFANAHYQSGWYRVANGQKIRLYRAGGQKLVLLPPRGPGVPVLYQPPDPEQFVAQLRQEWAGSS